MLENFKISSIIILTAVTGSLGINALSFLGITWIGREFLPFSLSWGEFASLYLSVLGLGALLLWLNVRWLGPGKQASLPGDFEMSE